MIADTVEQLMYVDFFENWVGAQPPPPNKKLVYTDDSLMQKNDSILFNLLQRRESVDAHGNEYQLSVQGRFVQYIDS